MAHIASTSIVGSDGALLAGNVYIYLDPSVALEMDFKRIRRSIQARLPFTTAFN
jgi:hypothetical protein